MLHFSERLLLTQSESGRGSNCRRVKPNKMCTLSRIRTVPIPICTVYVMLCFLFPVRRCVQLWAWLLMWPVVLDTWKLYTYLLTKTHVAKPLSRASKEVKSLSIQSHQSEEPPYDVISASRPVSIHCNQRWDARLNVDLPRLLHKPPYACGCGIPTFLELLRMSPWQSGWGGCIKCSAARLQVWTPSECAAEALHCFIRRSSSNGLFEVLALKIPADQQKVASKKQTQISVWRRFISATLSTKTCYAVSFTELISFQRSPTIIIKHFLKNTTAKPQHN